MKIPALLPILFASLLLWILPATTHAIMIKLESLEWITQTSQRVVVGKVTKVTPITAGDPEKTEYEIVTIAISQTLKGAAADHDTFLVDRDIEKDKTAFWLADGVDILFFLNPNDGKEIPIPADRVGWVLRHDRHRPDAISLGPIPRDHSAYILALTEDFNVLTPRDSIVEGVRRSIAETPADAIPHSCTFAVHNDAPDSQVITMPFLLTVPVNARLEATKPRPGANPETRTTATPVPGFCEISKPTRTSPCSNPCWTTPPPTNRRNTPALVRMASLSWSIARKEKGFNVRRAAFESLQELGVKVKKPVLEVLPDGGGDGKM